MLSVVQIPIKAYTTTYLLLLLLLLLFFFFALGTFIPEG